jgi:hypothetical protein
MIAVYVLRPDGSLGSAWIEDPAAPNGWREASSTYCQNEVGIFDFSHPNWWACWGIGYL